VLNAVKPVNRKVTDTRLVGEHLDRKLITRTKVSITAFGKGYKNFVGIQILQIVVMDKIIYFHNRVRSRITFLGKLGVKPCDTWKHN